jgi:hypothetical protein
VLCRLAHSATLGQPGGIKTTRFRLYEFRARDVGRGVPDPDFGDGPLDARKARLGDVLEDVGLGSIKYLYDFGDGWEHSVRIERVTEAEPGAVYPRLIEAAGCCPPEDIGGPWGYNEFLVAITDPNHERHAGLVEWSGGYFDPNAVDVDRHARAVEAFGRRWSRAPTVRRKRSN